MFTHLYWSLLGVLNKVIQCFKNINDCNYFASKLVLRYDNNGGEIPEKYKVIVCKPTLVNEMQGILMTDYFVIIQNQRRLKRNEIKSCW